jgi:hypothetical protein
MKRLAEMGLMGITVPADFGGAGAGYTEMCIVTEELAVGCLSTSASYRLKISATPVIQALKRLETSRIVNYIPNKGYFVGEITEIEARQLYHAREALETYIIPAVIQNLTPEKLDDIRKTFKKYEKANRRVLILSRCPVSSENRRVRPQRSHLSAPEGYLRKDLSEVSS